MVYQAAYAASMITPARNSRVKRDRARRFAAKAEANAQKHAPAGIAVALNLLVMGFLGTVTVRRFEEKRAAMEVEMGLLVETHGNGKPPGGGGGSGSPALNPQVSAPTTPIATMAMLTSTIVTPTFSVPTGTGITGVPSGLAHGTGSGNGTGTGNGSGTGSGTGSGNGSGVGNGNGNGVIDNRIPVILIYTEYNSINWENAQLQEDENISATRFDGVLRDLQTTFKVVATETVRNNNASGHKDKGLDEDLPDSSNLDSKTPTSARLAYELAQAHPEAAAIIYCGGWEDSSNVPEAFKMAEELGRRLNTMRKRFYMMTFSKWKGFASTTPFITTGKVTGGGFRNSTKEMDYEMRKYWVPPQANIAGQQ